jgi:ATP-dependent phosphofructokinase / diphosphate-dependent phosphofructokinase
MATIQGGRFVPIPFRDMIDRATGKIRVRRVAIASEASQTRWVDVIRLKAEDFERSEHSPSLRRTSPSS